MVSAAGLVKCRWEVADCCSQCNFAYRAIGSPKYLVQDGAGGIYDVEHRRGTSRQLDGYDSVRSASPRFMPGTHGNPALFRRISISALPSLTADLADRHVCRRDGCHRVLAKEGLRFVIKLKFY